MRLILTILFSFIFTQTIFAKDLSVISTIKPIDSLVKNVTQGVMDTEVLNEGKQSLHSLQLRPSQIAKLNKADIVFYIHSDFETFTKSAFKNLPETVKLIPLFNEELPRKLVNRELNQWHLQDKHDDGHEHHHNHESYDYHIWLNPENAATMVQKISDTLSEADPTHAVIYERNAINTINKLDKLNRDLINKLSSLDDRAFTVFHDAYQYFDDYYDLKIVGAFTLNPAYGLSPRHLSQMKKIIRDNHVVCAFSEPFMNENILTNLQKDLNLRTTELDPEGLMIPPSKNLYFTLMKRMGQNIQSCLKAQNQ